MTQDNDPGRCQLAETRSVLRRDLDATGDDSPQQIPGGYRQTTRVRRLISLSLDPLLLLAEDFLSPRPAILGAAEITRVRRHDAGID